MDDLTYVKEEYAALLAHFEHVRSTTLTPAASIVLLVNGLVILVTRYETGCGIELCGQEFSAILFYTFAIIAFLSLGIALWKIYNVLVGYRYSFMAAYGKVVEYREKYRQELELYYQQQNKNKTKEFQAKLDAGAIDFFKEQYSSINENNSKTIAQMIKYNKEAVWWIKCGMLFFLLAFFFMVYNMI